MSARLSERAEEGQGEGHPETSLLLELLDLLLRILDYSSVRVVCHLLEGGFRSFSEGLSLLELTVLSCF